MSSTNSENFDIELLRSIILAAENEEVAAASRHFDEAHQESNVNNNEAERDSRQNGGMSPSSSPLPCPHVRVNLREREEPPATREEIEKDLIFSSNHFITRFSRTLRRSEVLGFGFITITIMCIALQAQVGLDAMGYVEASGEPSSFEPHQIHSFSWKMLSEFYISDSISGYDKDCLYFNTKKRLMRSRDGNFVRDEADNSSEWEQLGRMALEESLANRSGISRHVPKCPETYISNAWSWLCRYMFIMFLPIANIIAATVLLSFICARRKKGILFALMIPSFLSVFVDIFQQVPMVFHYTYTSVVLVEEMTNSLSLTFPPMLVSPIWEETQIHGRCCGIHSPDTWLIQGYDGYPRSCCNTTKINSCEGDEYPRRSQIWPEGCFKHEYDRIRHYEFYSICILLLKLVAEMGILWSLSDLSRHEYPRPEHIHNSTATVKDFEVKTFGVARIQGVTDQPKMAVQLKNFKRDRYRFSATNNGTLKTIYIKTLFKTMGTIEIRRQTRHHNSEYADVDYDRGIRFGIVFLTF